jgi:hypothetical protein
MAEPNDKATPQGGNANPPASPPLEIEITRHGQKRKIPIEKAVELASKGLDYELRTVELKAREKALAEDEAAYAEFRRLRGAIASSPAARAALEAAINDPERVVSALEKGKPRAADAPGDTADDDESSPADKPSRVAPELAQRLEGVERRLDSFAIKEKRSELETRVERELKAYPWLDGNLKRMAFQQVAVALSQGDGSQTVESVVAEVANEFREAIEDLDKRRIESSEQKRRMTLSELRGQPLASGVKSHTLESMKRGDLRKDAVEAYQRLFARGLP